MSDDIPSMTEAEIAASKVGYGRSVPHLATLEEMKARKARFYEMARDRHSVAQFRIFPDRPQEEDAK